jgi:beta-glucosidase
VVLVSGNAVAMPWLDDVESVVQTWYLGSEAGNALARVLSGEVNPSGKLPFTFGYKLEDYPSHAEGMTFPNPDKVYYSEDIFVGYRGFEKRGIKPLFAFGHGLSYTEFEYSDIRLSKERIAKGETLRLSVTITNRGKRSGKEVVQLYIADKEASVARPVKELKGFEKVALEAGESKVVTFEITPEALSFYDDSGEGEWRSESGEFEVLIGSASDDIRLRKGFVLE